MLIPFCDIKKHFNVSYNLKVDFSLFKILWKYKPNKPIHYNLHNLSNICHFEKNGNTCTLLNNENRYGNMLYFEQYISDIMIPWQKEFEKAINLVKQEVHQVKNLIDIIKKDLKEKLENYQFIDINDNTYYPCSFDLSSKIKTNLITKINLFFEKKTAKENLIEYLENYLETLLCLLKKLENDINKESISEYEYFWLTSENRLLRYLAIDIHDDFIQNIDNTYCLFYNKSDKNIKCEKVKGFIFNQRCLFYHENERLYFKMNIIFDKHQLYKVINHDFYTHESENIDSIINKSEEKIMYFFFKNENSALKMQEKFYEYLQTDKN